MRWAWLLPALVAGLSVASTIADDDRGADRRVDRRQGSDIDDGYAKLRRELDEVERMKRELITLNKGEAMAKQAEDQAANQALRVEVARLEKRISELSATDAGKAEALAAKAEAANAVLRTELAEMKDRLASAIADSASLEAMVAVCKAAPEDKARTEISHLAASISELTRVGNVMKILVVL